MDDLNRSICKYVKSKQYFTDARNWYAHKFVYSISERSFIAILCSVYSVCAILILSFMSQIDPSDSYTYLVKIKDITRNYADIRSLGSVKENPQDKIDKYMLSLYVTHREQYDFAILNKILNGEILFLQTNSSPQEYQKYLNEISYHNVASPLYLYQDTVTINAKIEKIILHKNDDNQIKKADVYFTTRTLNIASNNSQTKNYVVNISYIIDNVEEDLTKEDLNFKVLNYTRNNGIKN